MWPLVAVLMVGAFSFCGCGFHLVVRDFSFGCGLGSVNGSGLKVCCWWQW